MKHWQIAALAALSMIVALAAPVRAQESETPEAEAPAEAVAPVAEAAPPSPPPAEEEPAKRPWSLSAELGLTLTTGNTKSRSVDGGIDAGYKYGKVANTLSFDALYGASEDSTTRKIETTDRRFVIAGKMHWDLATRQFLYVLADYENDAFATFRQKATESLGYGVKLVDEKTVRLNIEAGPAGRHTQPQMRTCVVVFPTVTCSRPFENDITARVALDAAWDISENATLSENAESTFGPKKGGGIQTKSTTALKAKVDDNLALKLEFEMRHVSEIPAGSTTKDIDTKTSAKLVYDF